MHESFGARLRLHREKQDVALKTIADETKISIALLEGLERDDISHWPSGIFRRAYVRAYAHAIGLNPDVVVREFFQVHPEPREIAIIEPPRRRGFLGSALGSLSLLRSGRAADTAPRSPSPRPAENFALNLPPLEERVPPAVPADAMTPEDAPAASPATEPPATQPAPVEHVDLLAAAELCTELGRVDDTSQVLAILRDAARLLDATGLIVWLYDGIASELRPALVHGYSDNVRAQLPAVKQGDDNATAAAFRSARTCTIRGVEGGCGALVVPMLAPAGCAGVLAIELPDGREQMPSVRAVAMFLAAMLAQLAGGTTSASEPAEPMVLQQNG